MEASELNLYPGVVAWAYLDPVEGREQGGGRHVLILAGQDYLNAVTTLVVVLPVTTVNRGWSNHIQLTGATGLAQASWVMTEQPRTISRTRISQISGSAEESCVAACRERVADFLERA